MHSHVSDDVHVAMPTHDSPDPQSFREAMNSTDAPQWKIAMERELEAFRRLDVLEMCMLPNGTNLISCKWLFIIKYNSDGSLNKYKSRLVARGFSQVHGLDFNKTFRRLPRWQRREFLSLWQISTDITATAVMSKLHVCTQY